VLVTQWLGVLVNHLYELCPIRGRSRRELERCGWWRPCRFEVDPLGADVEGLCGWCVRVWTSRNSAQTATCGQASGAGS
jgi:hypothetical protein